MLGAHSVLCIHQSQAQKVMSGDDKKPYPPVGPGEWVTPKRKGYGLGCCDCGLVHKMEFRLVPSWHGPGVKIQFRAWRDEKATKKLRKRMGK